MTATAPTPAPAPAPAPVHEPLSVSCTSSSSEVFRQAATLNNQGVVDLVNHKEEAAIKVLTNSIRLMKSELSKPNMGCSGKKTKGGTSICLDLPAEMVELSREPSPTRDQPLIFHDDDEDMTIFTHATVIPLSVFSDEMETSDLDCHIYSAAVVFNLALAHHQLALKHKQDRRRRTNSTERHPACLYTTNRSKAEKLYNVILKLLQDSACSQVRAGVMIKLAAIHNLYWIQYQKREEQEFRPRQVSQEEQEETPSLQHTLSRFVRGVRQSNPLLVQSLLENDAQIQGLLMNVLWLKDQQAVPRIAPAA